MSALLEDWKRVWRDGIAPIFSLAHLESLRDALRDDSPELIQGNTTAPLPIDSNADCPVVGACALGYPVWKCEGVETVAGVESWWALICRCASERLGNLDDVAWFIEWFDSTPREKMRRQLLAEVKAAIEEREGAVCGEA